MSKSFKDSQKKKENLVIVDGFNFSFRYKHANTKQFAVQYLQTMQSFAQSYGAKKMVILSDGGSAYRESIYPEYKIDRKIMKEKQTEEEKANFQEFFKDWLVAFELCGTEYPTIQYKGVEADDIAAYLATNKDILDAFEHIWLISTDKDWDLLVSDKVSRFSYKTRKEITIDNWDAHYNYPQKDHISIKVLQGDKGDSVEGVPGIGEKRAAELIRTYGSAYDILASLPIADKRVYMQNLNKFGNNILLNYQLMDLIDFSDEAIGDNIDDLNEKIGEIIT